MVGTGGGVSVRQGLTGLAVLAAIAGAATCATGNCEEHEHTLGKSQILYRGGGRNVGNFTPRPRDHGELSFWDSLSNRYAWEAGVFKPGGGWVAVDTRGFPVGSVFATPPPGHYVVAGVPPQVIQAAIVGSSKFPKLPA